MRVTVTELYTDKERSYSGAPDQIRQDLLKVYGPFLHRMNVDDTSSFREVLEGLEGQQAFSVDVQQDLQKTERNLEVEPNSEIVRDMHGYRPQLEAAFAAAQFLSGGGEPPLDSIRRLLWEEDGNIEVAALRAYDMEPDEAGLSALRAVLALQELRKAEPLPSNPHIEAAESGKVTAEKIRRAAAEGTIQAVSLGGKHSKGSLLVRDDETESTTLLKPGSGGASPAAGASQDPSSQSEREAGFYEMARLWGLGDSLPRCDLVIVDGRQYAAITMLGYEYKPLEKLKAQDGNAPRKLLEPYREKGTLHRWAVMDFVLGNVDRHAANIMASDTDIKLIDHGSAFAGPDFDPSYDRNSFIPFYLRYPVPAGIGFNKLAAADKLRYLVSAPASVHSSLKSWVDTLTVEQLEHTLPGFGIDYRAAAERLRRLQGSTGPVDQRINRLWAGT